MKYFKKLEGERIYLSPISLEDAEIYTKWMNDSKVLDGTHGNHRMNNVESEKEWISNNLQNGLHNFAIVLKEENQLIGNCGIMDINHIDRTATLGIFIGEESYRNQGYGAEALKLLLKYGFDILNLHNIHLKVFRFNERAIHCYEKIGFREYGCRHECYFLNGAYHDEVLMEILESEWRNKNEQ